MVPGMDELRSKLKHLAVLVVLAGAAFQACRPATAGGKRVPPSREAELSKFRAGLAQPESLSGGAKSRDALVWEFVRALEARDTAALVAMHMTRAEFAWFYYPTNPQAQPPYNLSPDLMWFMEHGNSERGVQRLLDARAGQRLGVVGYRCDPITSRQGDNTVMGPCVVRRVTANRDTTEERLFGLILEREGRFKFVSYANKL